MQACHYKDRFVVPAVHEKSPRDYYATFCIDYGRKSQCYTVRPNFKTKGQAMEAGYKAGRAKVDALLAESKWDSIKKRFKRFTQNTPGEKRKAQTVYIS